MPPVLLVVALAWGALAFGSVYPWAYTPLAVVSVTLGAVGLLRRRPDVRLSGNAALTIGAAVLAGAIALQLLPVPRPAVRALSPATYALAARLQPAEGARVAGNGAGWLPSSTDPSDTAVALWLFVAFGVLFLGTVRGLSARETRRLLDGLATLGVLLSLLALVQRAVPTGLFYGWWQPEIGPRVGHRGGPFVNRNHLAGWLLMALPLVLGSFIGRAQQVVERAGRGVRERVLYFASRAGTRTILLGAAIPVMGLGLVHTLSRAGIAGFVLSLLAVGTVVGTARAPGRRRLLVLGYCVLVAWFAFTRTGLEPIAERFEADGLAYADRLAAWRDTWRIFADVPLAGCGLGTYSRVMLVYQTAPVGRLEYAHNDYVQLLAEGGVLVSLPAALLLALFVREVRRRFREDTPDRLTYWTRVGAVTGLLAIGFQEVVDFSLHMPGVAALFAVTAAVAAGRLPHREGFRVLASRP